MEKNIHILSQHETLFFFFVYSKPKVKSIDSSKHETLKKITVLIYSLNAIGLTPGGSSTVHIYTQTIQRTTQLTTLFGRLSGIQAQSGKTKINGELTA